jgi:hypothetical protein
VRQRPPNFDDKFGQTGSLIREPFFDTCQTEKYIKICLDFGLDWGILSK